MGNIGDIISNETISQFNNYIAEKFAENGYIDITQDEGLFISSVPRK
ncbi:MAG: hypothetical protein LBI27_09055 [Clostridiales bacterium]|jgi:hypothetical protein|nr:hypothetical protein [Clostridiales bacterium]